MKKTTTKNAKPRVAKTKKPAAVLKKGANVMIYENALINTTIEGKAKLIKFIESDEIVSDYQLWLYETWEVEFIKTKERCKRIKRVKLIKDFVKKTW